MPPSVTPMPTPTPTSVERGVRFRALHERTFVIPNPWDAGSARLLAAAGFEALATTSAGSAARRGRTDGSLDLADTLADIAEIDGATDLPVSADLESGFGDDPATVAGTILAAAGAGAVGGSIEDRCDGDLYDAALAVDRVAAAVEAARELPHEFVVTARCESFLVGRPDLPATIARLQAYQEAGADVVYAPGLTSLDDVRAVVTSVDVPVNVVVGLGGATWSVAELADVGVRRISVGSALARAAYGALLRASDEILGCGTFDWAADAVPFTRLHELLRDDTAPVSA